MPSVNISATWCSIPLLEMGIQVWAHIHGLAAWSKGNPISWLRVGGNVFWSSKHVLILVEKMLECLINRFLQLSWLCKTWTIANDMPLWTALLASAGFIIFVGLYSVPLHATLVLSSLNCIRKFVKLQRNNPKVQNHCTPSTMSVPSKFKQVYIRNEFKPLSLKTIFFLEHTTTVKSHHSHPQVATW